MSAKIIAAWESSLKEKVFFDAQVCSISNKNSLTAWPTNQAHLLTHAIYSHATTSYLKAF